MLGVEVMRLADAASLPPPDERAPHLKCNLNGGDTVADACPNSACEPEARGSYLQHCQEHLAVLRSVSGLMPFGFGRR